MMNFAAPWLTRMLAALCIGQAAPAWAATHNPGIEQVTLRHIYTGDFISPEADAQAGEVVDADADSLLLRPGDVITVKFSHKVLFHVGDRLITYAAARPLAHPRNKHVVGFLTEVAGVAQVTDVAGEFVQATLVQAVAEVERGQRVARLSGPLFIDVPTHAPKVALQGEVLAVAHKLMLGSEQRHVYLDRGTAQGLRLGDVVQVMGRRDTANRPANAARPALPMAQAVVVATQANTSAAWVVDSLWEIAAGNAFFAEAKGE